MKKISIFFLAAAFAAVTSAKSVDAFEYSAGGIPCRLTWTGPKTGWRLQTFAQSPNGAADAAERERNGAVQKLAAFMDEPPPSTAQPFDFDEKDGRRLCRAADGSSVSIDAQGLVDVCSASGKRVTEGVAPKIEKGKAVLAGRLSGDEPVYGLGERLDRLNKRGQRIHLYILDGWNDSGTTYMAIPFFATARGGGVFMNHYEEMTADFDVTEKNVWRMEVEKATLDVYLFAKDRIPDALAAYTALSGHADVPEAWNMGPVICRYHPDLTRFDGPFVCKYGATNLRGHGLKEMVEKHIAAGVKPAAVIVEGGDYVDLHSNPTKRERLKVMADYLREKDVKLMVYMRMGSHCTSHAPGFHPDFVVSASVKTNGVLVQADTKQVPSRFKEGVNPDMGKARPLTYVDVTDPAFWDWYINVVWKDLVDCGIRGVKIDFCDWMTEEGVNPGGVEVHYKWKNPAIFAGTAVHQAYPTFFISKFYRAASALAKDKGGFMVLSRGGGIGSQRSPFLWAGDQMRNFGKLDDHVLAMLNSGMSGVPFMTYDMAGYQYDNGCLEPDGEIAGTPVFVRRSRTLDAATEAAVFRRGVEFTAFSPCVQSHGYVRNSYEFDEATQAHYRKFMKIHAGLSNVVARLNREAAATGVPPVRPLVFRWPDDPKTWNVFDEYLLGDALLVAPVFGAEPRKDVYLPKGDWVRVPDLEIPVYVDKSHPDAHDFDFLFAKDATPLARRPKIDVLCVYYPHWHRYAKGDEWFGAERWKAGEWCFVKDAKPRFAGAKQPLVPYAGFLDESNPEDMAKDVALAANAGIDVFLYDYYYYDGKVTQEAALEKGFLGAVNRNRMKFALMWCYHERNDQFRPEITAPRRALMKLAHTKDEFFGLIDLSIQRYFPRPEYYRKDGKLFFSIYNFSYFLQHHGNVAAQVRAELEEARRRVRAAGLGEVHFNAQNVRPHLFAIVKDCGFDSITDYNVGAYCIPPSVATALRAAGKWEVDYAAYLPYAEAHWATMSKCDLPYIPQVTTGWDSTPRCRFDEPYPWKANAYPYTMSIKNNTPDLFAKLVADAKAHAENDPHHPGAIYVNGWNEYTEGTYLVPNNFDADGFLRGIAASFGRHPANEYTYVNPSTKELMTVQAATIENLAYGAHPKQKVDVWLPKNAKGKTPVLVYLHGGGWTGGAMVDRILGLHLKGLLDKGIAVVAVGYRYLRDVPREKGVPPVKGCIDDCAAAVAFVKAHAAAWNLDADRLGLAGGSAGACTALILAYSANNALGVKALAPVIPQTSLDPVELKAWIPNSKYGAHAFGYRDFADWTAHRADCAQWIDAYSPASLARRIAPGAAPCVVLRAPKPVDGVLPRDPTHAPAFCWKFAEICTQRGLPCDMAETGDAIDVLADKL